MRPRLLKNLHAAYVTLEQRPLAFDPAHGVVVQDHAPNSAGFRQRTRLWLYRLRSEHALDRGQERVPVQQLQVPGQLFDSIDARVPLDPARNTRASARS